MISLKQLKYALAIDQHRHFKKAAESCAISQSALSSAINDMEAQLGFQVFERDNKKVLVTSLGREVLDRANKIFVDVNDLQSLAGHGSEPLSGPLAIGMIPTIAPYLIPLLLPELKKEFGNLHMTIEEDQSQHLVERVMSGELDAAVLALPYDCPGLLTFPFWEENFYLVLHEDDNPDQAAQVKSADIDLSGLMLLKEGHCLKDHALSVCGGMTESNVNITGTSLSTMIELVAAGMGTTLIPQIARHQLLQAHPHLQALKLDEKGPHRTLAIAVRPSYPRLADLELLKQIMVRRLRELPGV
jgi:LysR family hydrogen peroxide-inducible transcriptional activator